MPDLDFPLKLLRIPKYTEIFFLSIHCFWGPEISVQ